MPDDDVLMGLRARSKYLPPRVLDDAARIDPALLDRLARPEQALLQRFLPTLVERVGPRARVLEPFPTAPATTRLLLRNLATTPAGRPLVILMHDAIGRFVPGEARIVLRGLHRPGGRLLLSADATRDRDLLLRAYDDPAGVMEAVAKQALEHINDTHAATFEPAAFDYHASWDPDASRMEIALVSTCDQQVHVAGERIAFAAGEPLRIAHHHKHTPAALDAMLTLSGWRPCAELAAPDRPLRLWLCEPL